MKFIIQEGNLKSFIKKKLGVDLTGKIKMITSIHDIPNRFTSIHFDKNDFGRLLNRYGTFFLIDAGHGREFLVQDRNDDFIGLDNNQGLVTEKEVLEYLRLDMLGLKLSKIIDMYFDEEGEENLNESVTAVKRRLSKIDDMYQFAINIIYTKEKICSLYISGDMLLDVIIEYIVEKMYYDYFGNIPDTSEEWFEMFGFMEKYIRIKYGDSVKEYYRTHCSKKDY